ncbi:MAG: hypothetical protein IKA47_09530 [Oscillospiraceae bacterium]|nr:hypothetical protein [Oscillospiraceae bacterium]
MYCGKYQKKRKGFALGWVLLCMALIGTAIGSVAAYLSIKTPPVENTFVAEAPTDPVIQETFTENTSLEKKNVSVDVGTPGYAVYVRAAVVVTWQDDAGNVLSKAPVVGTDYSIQYNAADWFQYDGFWYCRTMINSGNSPVLITTCQPLVSKDACHLNVEIVSQTIQALGTTDEGDIPAVTNAWGVKVDNGKLVQSQTS